MSGNAGWFYGNSRGLIRIAAWWTRDFACSNFLRAGQDYTALLSAFTSSPPARRGARGLGALARIPRFQKFAELE